MTVTEAQRRVRAQELANRSRMAQKTKKKRRRINAENTEED